MRPISDEEREDARIEEAERREARWQLLRGHLYDPTCGCDECEPPMSEEAKEANQRENMAIGQEHARREAMADRLGDWYGDDPR